MRPANRVQKVGLGPGFTGCLKNSRRGRAPLPQRLKPHNIYMPTYDLKVAPFKDVVSFRRLFSPGLLYSIPSLAVVKKEARNAALVSPGPVSTE